MSPITLDALSVRSIPVKTIEMERPLYHLLSRCTELDRLFTSGIGKYPKIPSVRYLHLRHNNRLTEGHPNSCIAACSSRLTTLYTTDTIYAELLAVLDTVSSTPSRYCTLTWTTLGRNTHCGVYKCYEAERISHTYKPGLQRWNSHAFLVSHPRYGLLSRNNCP